MNGKDTACFSRASDEWSTPQWLFDLLDREFHFDVDAAANDDNKKCLFLFDVGCDTLVRPWFEDGELEQELNELGQQAAKVFWFNPPYSKISAFMKKAYEESLKGAVVVCLIPCRTDTRYWHDYVMKAQEIRFVKGRLKFGDSKTGAPFPSVIVIFNRHVPEGYARLIWDAPHIGKTIEQPKAVQK
jgi:site-specific DNA-methyltransferase (adenine-specific)